MASVVGVTKKFAYETEGFTDKSMFRWLTRRPGMSTITALTKNLVSWPALTRPSDSGRRYNEHRLRLHREVQLRVMHDMMLEGSPNLDDHPHHPESAVTSADDPLGGVAGIVDFYQDMQVKDIGLDDAESDSCAAQRPIGVRMFGMSSLPGVSTRDLRQHCQGRRLPSSQDTERPTATYGSRESRT